MRTTRQTPAQKTLANRPTERRTRQHLRELCDEVIWSFRIASDRDLISEQERKEARAMLANMVPLAR